MSLYTGFIGPHAGVLVFFDEENLAVMSVPDSPLRFCGSEGEYVLTLHLNDKKPAISTALYHLWSLHADCSFCLSVPVILLYCLENTTCPKLQPFSLLSQYVQFPFISTRNLLG